MATIINIQESNQSLDGRNVKIPNDLMKTLKQNNKIADTIYGDNVYYKKSDGYKRNQRITNKDYNTRGEDKNKEGIVSYNDLVKWKHDMEHMPRSDKNIAYQLNGGKKAEAFVNNELSHLRNSVAPQNQVKKSENISKSNLKPKNKPTDTVKIDKEDVHIHEQLKEYINKLVRENL